MGMCAHCTGMQAGKVLVICRNLVHFPGNNKPSHGSCLEEQPVARKAFSSVTITTFMIFGILLRIILETV